MNPLRPQRIYIAGHRGMVGSALVRRLRAGGYDNLIVAERAQLDLLDGRAVQDFVAQHRPDYIFIAAAKVGGIQANNQYRADFIYQNLMIEANLMQAAHEANVQRLMFLGSSCIYPKLAPQPLRESSLLSGPLEPTNRPYAIAKIAGIEMCWSYNRQYGTRFLAAMPTNLYGPGDNYHALNSHVIPGLLRKFHAARTSGADKVVVWGTGTVLREFMFSDDMAAACVFLMSLPDAKFDALLGSDESASGRFEPPLVNVGVGTDLTIGELALLVKQVTGFEGEIVFDPSKPDGTPRKLLDVSLLARAGWKATTTLADGLRIAYRDYLADQASMHATEPAP